MGRGQHRRFYGGQCDTYIKPQELGLLRAMRNRSPARKLSG